MKHKIDDPVQHDHNVELNTQDIEDLAEVLTNCAIKVIGFYMIADTIRHVVKKAA